MTVLHDPHCNRRFGMTRRNNPATSVIATSARWGQSPRDKSALEPLKDEADVLIQSGKWKGIKARAISDAQQTAPNIEEKSGREKTVSACELGRPHGNPDTHNRAIHSSRARAATEAAASSRP